MFLLDATNALDYLHRIGRLPAGPVVVEELSGGVSNVVLRVRGPEQTLVLKQSRPQLRTRDAWFSDLDRVYREQEVMEVLAPRLPAGSVPEVLFADRPNYVFAMSHVPEPFTVWKQDLLAGRVEPSRAEQAGTLLGHIHQQTAADPALVKRFADRTVFVQLRVDPFYRRVQERRPEVADAVEPLIRELERPEALCQGDFSPKNLLAHARGLTLVDYETAHHGNPAMDLGFFLSHLMLKAVRAAPDAEPFFELTRRFWRAYAAVVRYRPADEAEAAAVPHAAVCLLARIDGTSPVDYLPDEPRREAVRRLGRRMLHDRPTRWSEVLTLATESLP